MLSDERGPHNGAGKLGIQTLIFEQSIPYLASLGKRQ